MKLNGKAQRTIWLEADGTAVGIIDQTRLPHAFKTVTLKTLDDAAYAIKAMLVRGAPLIGATAAYGMALAMRENASDQHVTEAANYLVEQRPTAVNLKWATDEMVRVLEPLPPDQRVAAAYGHAAKIVVGQSV